MLSCLSFIFLPFLKNKNGRKRGKSFISESPYNNRPSHAIFFIPTIASTSGSLHGKFVCLLFLQDHRETDRFLAASGVQLPQTNFQFRHPAFYSQIRSKVGHILSNVFQFPVQPSVSQVCRSISFIFPSALTLSIVHDKTSE